MSGGSAAAAEKFPPIALNRAPLDASAVAGDTSGAMLGAVTLTLLEDEVCVWRGTFDSQEPKIKLKWYQKLFALCKPAKEGECGCGPVTIELYKPKIVRRRNVMLTNKRLIIQVSSKVLS